MNVVTIAIGLACWLIAIIFGYRSVKCKDTDGRIKVMRAMLGDTKGMICFRFTYIAMPLFIGSMVVIAGYDGYTIAEFLQGANRN